MQHLITMNDEFISGLHLPEGLHSHRMVTSDDEKELFIVGGYDGPYGYGFNRSFKPRKQVLQLQCEGADPSTCSFKEIESKLFFARAGHIALPLTDSFASHLCS